MEHVNGWCFSGIYKGGLWENDLHVSAQRDLELEFLEYFFLIDDCEIDAREIIMFDSIFSPFPILLNVEN